MDNDRPTAHTFFHSVQKADDLKERRVDLFYSSKFDQESKLENSTLDVTLVFGFPADLSTGDQHF